MPQRSDSSVDFNDHAEVLVRPAQASLRGPRYIRTRAAETEQRLQLPPGWCSLPNHKVWAEHED